MAKNAIGILFEVKGQGSIKAGSGLRIKNQLEDIVKAINKDAPPKIDLKINQVEFKKEVESAKKLLEDLKRTADGIKMPTGSGGKQGGKKGSGGSGSSDYKKRIADVKKYFSELKKLQRDASRNGDFSLEGTEWVAKQGKKSAQGIQVDKINKQYEKFNNTLKELEISFDAVSNEYGRFKDVTDENTGETTKKFLPLDDADIAEIAKNKGVAENEVRDLYNTIRELGRQNIVDQGNIAEGALNAWTNNANKYSDWLKDHYDTISKDPASKKLANQLKDIIDSKDPKRLDDLKNKWGELSDRVRESGSDIDTWGQTFSKTFSSRVRSALAGVITAKIGQAINDIYKNVVKLDDAVVDLQIASGKTRDEAKTLVKEYAALAKQLGATTAEVAAGADTWLRQGYAAEEANTLIRNSTMLAKLGQMESAEASTALTSAMKGYNVSVEDSIGIVDKWTAVDMKAAASAGDLATAMQETSASAGLAGVSMDKLIGYVATVKEVTQDGSESVGVFFKTLFARMNNVAAGKFVDDETGEALNDVESVLGELGIELRGINGEFRSSSAVLDDVATRWNEFNDTERNAIATAMAGARNFEKFNVLMQNYGTALDYAEVSAGSAGTANEKYEDTLQGINAKLNTLTATFEEFSMSVLDSEWVVTGVEFLTSFVEVLNWLASIGDGVIVIFSGIAIALTVLQAVFITIKPKIVDFIAKLAGVSLAADGATLSLSIFGKAMGNLYSTGILGLLTALPRLALAIIQTGIAMTQGAKLTTAWDAALKSLNLSPTIAALTAIIAVGVAAHKAIKKIANARIENAEAAKEEAAQAKENVVTAKAEAKQLEELINRYEELKASEVFDSSIREEIRNIQKEINALVKNEVYEVDLLNDSLDENLKKYNQIKKAKAEEAADEAKETYASSKNSANLAFEGDYEAAGDSSLAKLIFDHTMEGDLDWDAYHILREQSVGLGYTSGQDLFRKYTGLKFANGTDAASVVDTLDAAIEALIDDDSYDHLESEFYGELVKLRDKYKPLVADVSESASILAEGVIGSVSANMDIDEDNIDSIEAYNNLRQAIIDATMADEDLKEAIDAKDISKNDVISAVDSYLDTEHSGLYDKVAKINTNTLKSLCEVIEEVEGGYDALYDALDDINEQGIISADTLKAITDPSNGYPAIEKYLTKTTNGYILAEGALEDYIATQKEAYVAALAAAEEGSEAQKIAYQNLENILLIFATKELERGTEAAKAALEKKKEALEDTKKPLEDQKEALEDEIDALEKEKEALEKSKKPLEEKQEAYEEQLDRYEELIEVRKELLESYREELEYQKELEKKQRNVASLRTRLSVAKLDTSAAGQARVRELESELQEAEEDLNDFTLEHAIDVITTQLDSQLSQYESYIGAKVSEITTAIDGIDDAIEGVETEIDGVEESIDEIEGKLKDIDDSIDDVDDAISSAADGVKGAIGSVGGEIKTLLDEYLKKQDEKDKEEEDKKKARKAVQDYVDTHNMTEGDRGRWRQDPRFNTLFEAYVELGGDLDDINGAPESYKITKTTSLTSAAGGQETMSYDEYKTKLVNNGGDTSYLPYPNSWQGALVKENEGYTWVRDGNNVTIEYQRNAPLYSKVYHKGGLVGNIATLKTSEEFAKLLQGEFVSTPAQMKNFMQKTLPQIASYNSSTGNEFNAPLINITCDNVTSETLPSLEKIVNNAVVEIKKQLDSGMSRAGFKPSAKKLLL